MEKKERFFETEEFESFLRWMEYQTTSTGPKCIGWLRNNVKLYKTIRPLREGVWYMVKVKDGDWFPAKCDFAARGGWTNEDTWDNSDKEVIDWRGISLNVGE